MEREKLAELVVRVQKDDSAAADRLFGAIYDDVYYFALKTVKEHHLAEDITQEALIEVFCHIKELNDPLAFPAWCRQITYTRCTRYFRKTHESLVEENEDGSSIFDIQEEEREEFIPDAALEQAEFRKTVMEIIDTLSEDQRSAVLMYYFDNLSVSEIASIQGVSDGTVKSRLNYARKAIRAEVEAYEKKHGTKLHAIPFFPLLRFLFTADKKATAIPEALLATCKAAALGTAAPAATATTATVTAGATAKAVGLSLGAKIAIGIVAVAVVAGAAAGIAGTMNKDEGDDDDDEPQALELVVGEVRPNGNVRPEENVVRPTTEADDESDRVRIVENIRYEKHQDYWVAYPAAEEVDESVTEIEILSEVDGIPVQTATYTNGEFARVYPNLKSLIIRCRIFRDPGANAFKGLENTLEKLVIGKEVTNGGFYFYDFTALSDIIIEENVNRIGLSLDLNGTAFYENEDNWVIQEVFDENYYRTTTFKYLVCSNIVIEIDAQMKICEFHEGIRGFSDGALRSWWNQASFVFPSSAVFGIERLPLVSDLIEQSTIQPSNPVYRIEGDKIVRIDGN